MLYNPLTLNQNDFKSGRYATFAKAALDDYSFISRYDSSGKYIPKFYKVKLYHQLNNGTIDLTEDVWTKYITAVNNPLHWFGDATFKYYCPTQFKGKLLASVELEDIYNFRLKNIPQIDQTISDFTITFNVDTTLKPSIDPEFNSIKFSKIAIRYRIDNGLWENTILTDIDKSKVTDVVLSSIPISNLNRILEYEMTPIVSYEGGTDTYNKDTLPKEFFDTHTLRGKLKLGTSVSSIKFEPVLTNFTCDGATGTKIYNEYILMDENGSYLTNERVQSNTPYVFLRDGYTLTNGNTEMASYILQSTGKPYVNGTTLTVEQIIKDLFEQTTIRVDSPECSEDIYIDLTLDFNIALTASTRIIITQAGEPNQEFTGLTSSSLVVTILKDENVKIEVYRSGYEDIIETSLYSVDANIDVAFIANVKFIVEGNYNDSSGYYWIDWISEDTLPSGLALIYQLDAGALSNSIELIYANNSYSSSPVLIVDELNFTFTSVDLNVTSTDIISSYINITQDFNLYGSINGIIFRRKIA